MPRTEGPTGGRRHFLSQLAAAGAVLGAGCAPPTALHASGTQSAPWDDSWTHRVRGHEAILFDSPEFNNGAALDQAAVVMDNYRDAINVGDGELATVLVMRHRGVPMAFNDFLWDKYGMGAEFKLKDPVTGEPARRNPFLSVEKGDAHKMIEPGASISALRARGAILLGCNSAAMGYASILAKRVKGDEAAIQKEIRANLVPGVILQPTGIYAVMRAQNAGCAFFR